jgi:hypothetical protein
MRRGFDPEAEIARLATRQHGVVARRQLIELGLSRSAIDRRLRARRLLPVFAGVHAVGHGALRDEGWWMAAVLACGPGAVLSHHAAASLWELRDWAGGAIDVTTASRSGRASRRGIALHRVRALPDGARAQQARIPVTSVARTAIDLAPRVGDRDLEQLVARGLGAGLLTLAALRALVAAQPNGMGAARVRALLGRLAGTGAADLRSRLEVDFAALCDTYNLPAPRTNVCVEGLTVDAFWPHAGLIAEADGYEFHSMPTAFETDRLRDQRLIRAGHRVIRFTYRQVVDRPAEVAETLRSMLVPA